MPLIRHHLAKKSYFIYNLVIPVIRYETTESCLYYYIRSPEFLVNSAYFWDPVKRVTIQIQSLTWESLSAGLMTYPIAKTCWTCWIQSWTGYLPWNAASYPVWCSRCLFFINSHFPKQLFNSVFRSVKSNMTINPHLPSGPVHPYQLDESVSNFMGVWCTFPFLFFYE